MGTCAVFIDGGYLDKVLGFDHGNARLDYNKLAREMASPDELMRAYYYHCLPYQGSPPTNDERQRYAAKHRFFTALAHLPRFDVRLGRLQFQGISQSGERIFVQKRVDNMIGVDMALLAGKGKVTNVAILTGDSDYIPSIEAVKREGVLVSLWHGALTSPHARPSRDLFELCDERFELTHESVDRMRRAI